MHATGQALRKMLFTHIVQDVKRINQASRRDAFGQHRSFPRDPHQSVPSRRRYHTPISICADRCGQARCQGMQRTGAAVQTHTNHKVNRELQNFMYSMMDEKNGIAAKKSLQARAFRVIEYPCVLHPFDSASAGRSGVRPLFPDSSPEAAESQSRAGSGGAHVSSSARVRWQWQSCALRMGCGRRS